MRVLYVNPVGELGGSERSLFDLVAALRRLRPELEQKLVLFTEGELAKRVRELGVAVEVLPLPKALSTLGEFSSESRDSKRSVGSLVRGAASALPFVRSLRGAISAFRPDLVHTNGMKAHVLAAVAAPELRRVVHLRDFVSERPVTRRLLRLVGRRALVLANSRAVEADALVAWPSLWTRVVYNGIDLEEFRPRPRELAHLATLSGLEVPPDETIVVGLVATYAWWKGHLTFLDAAARVRAAVPERSLRFYVVGGPVYRTSGSQVSEAELREALETHGLSADVGLVPFQNDVARVYQGLDVMVHASERPEPFGRTIVEAMAAGRAVVAARSGGAIELFDEGRTALGFEPKNASDLARAMLELVANGAERGRMAMDARRDAEARFGRERLGSEVFAAYEALAAQGRRT